MVLVDLISVLVEFIQLCLELFHLGCIFGSVLLQEFIVLFQLLNIFRLIKKSFMTVLKFILNSGLIKSESDEVTLDISFTLLYRVNFNGCGLNIRFLCGSLISLILKILLQLLDKSISLSDSLLCLLACIEKLCLVAFDLLDLILKFLILSAL